ncbi:MAG: GTPase HflX [Ruminococcaceae bacterium]|nr:GTPase HflX [Oscillospiraceae bacterium]
MDDNLFEKRDSEKRLKAVLVGVVLQNDKRSEIEESLEELERLLDTAGGDCAAIMIQSRTVPDAATYIGSGKIGELKELCKNNSAELVVFDGELSPSQIKNLEADTDVRVIDRSMLILDIFALHAVTNEGKLQVELAQLKYTIPRLTGKGKELSRLGGGIGTRGPGESKLETDRRHILRRIAALEEELREVEQNRSTQRRARERAAVFGVAIAGYTNAGKSTLLNKLTDAGILAENKLFATLDPTTRRYRLPSGTEILLTDTVGFIKKLPHQLIKAFRSTLEEVKYADAVIILADASDSGVREKLEVSTGLIEELEASGKPLLYVFNKCDLVSDEEKQYLPISNDTVYISALTGEGLDKLTEKLEELASDGKSTLKFLFPHSDSAGTAKLYKFGTVKETAYTEEGTLITATVDAKLKGQLEKYILK